MNTYEILTASGHDAETVGQYELLIGGLAVGGETEYGLAALSGPRDLPALRTDDQARASDHGATQGIDYIDPRIISFDLLVKGESIDEIDQAIRAIAAAWPVGADLPITGNTGTRWSCVGRMRRRSAPMTFAGEAGLMSRVSFEFHCADPFLYGPQSSASVLASPAVGGRRYPRVYPLTYPAATAPGLVVTNSGTMPTDWVATLTGPLTDPTIELAGTGEALNFTGDIPAGQTLTVSSRDRSVLLGSSSRYQWLRPSSRWFRIPPGSSNIAFRATGSGSLSILWRSATA